MLDLNALLLLTAGIATAQPAAPEAGGPLLTMQDALDRAREQNLDLQIGQERLARASVLSKKAWAFVLPVLRTRAAINRNDQEIVVPFGLPEELRPLFESTGIPFPPPQNVEIQKLTQRSASATLSWTLLNGRSIPLIQNAYDGVDVARLTYAQMERLILDAVARSYYNVLTTTKQIEIRNRAIDNAQHHMDLAAARREIGETTDVQVLRAEVQVATEEQELVRAENADRIARLSLATLLNLVDETGQPQPFSLVRPPDPQAANNTDPITLAYDERLDLAQRGIELRMAERAKLETWLKFMPAVVGTGFWQWTDSSGFAGDNTTWQLGLALEWTLFEGGLTYWELEEREHEIRAARLMVDKARKDVAREVREALINLDSARANLVAAQRRVQLARKTAELMQAQYELGAATELEALDANQALGDAETAESLGQLLVDLAGITVERVIDAPATVAMPEVSLGP